MRIRLAALALLTLSFAGCGGPEEPSGPGPLAVALKAKADESAAKIPEEVKALFKRAGNELAATKLLAQAKTVGDEAPGFTLRGLFGAEVSLASFLEDGPVVVAFYRGKW
ncbi:MAG: hypothetical protein QNJ98_05200 [Planctomycetota bacterium]|nr:hypothetical protein [Planctomycetota bacterium]